ncbi:MAG TPA: hypothetical protein VGE06_03680 [Flavisolibacter sp.]
MKRLLYGSVLWMTIGLFTSCAQHDPNSPDTSGAMPSDHPNVGVDTVSSQYGTGMQNMTTNDTTNGQAGNTTDTSGRNNR